MIRARFSLKRKENLLKNEPKKIKNPAEIPTKRLLFNLQATFENEKTTNIPKTGCMKRATVKISQKETQ